MADNNTTVSTAMAAPKRVQSDGVVVEAHPLPDVIEAVKYLDGQTAVKKTGSLGIRLQKLKPPGAD